MFYGLTASAVAGVGRAFKRLQVIFKEIWHMNYHVNTTVSVNKSVSLGPKTVRPLH